MIQYILEILWLNVYITSELSEDDIFHTELTSILPSILPSALNEQDIFFDVNKQNPYTNRCIACVVGRICQFKTSTYAYGGFESEN